MKKNTKILIGLGLAGAGAYYLWNRNKSKSSTTPKSDAEETAETTEEKSVDTGTKEPKTREEKENYVIENVQSTTKEDLTGFDGDRFEFNPNVGYEMPVGTVQSTSEGDTWDVNFPESDAFDVFSGGDGEMNSEYSDLDDYDAGYDIFFGVDDEPTDNPVDEAKAVVQALSDDELDKAVKVVKTAKADPSKEQADILQILGAEGITAEKIARMLNDLKVLKKQPDWKAMYEQEKAKSRRGMGVLRRKWRGVARALERLERRSARFEKRCGEKFDKLAQKTRYVTAEAKNKARAEYVARCLKRRGASIGSMGRGRLRGKLGKIRAKRMGRLAKLRSKQTKENVQYCLRHPHKCQNKLGNQARQKVKTFVSSRPRLKRIYDNRLGRVQKRTSRRLSRRARRR